MTGYQAPLISCGKGKRLCGPMALAKGAPGVEEEEEGPRFRSTLVPLHYTTLEWRGKGWV